MAMRRKAKYGENTTAQQGYTDDELSGLWRGFRTQENAVKMLADFACTSTECAAAMIARWERR